MGKAYSYRDCKAQKKWISLPAKLLDEIEESRRELGVYDLGEYIQLIHDGYKSQVKRENEINERVELMKDTIFKYRRVMRKMNIIVEDAEW